jgi:hypothetical protein
MCRYGYYYRCKWQDAFENEFDEGSVTNSINWYMRAAVFYPDDEPFKIVTHFCQTNLISRYVYG